MLRALLVSPWLFFFVFPFTDIYAATAADLKKRAAVNIAINLLMIDETDTTPPSIVLSGPVTETIIQGSIYSDPGATATDDTDDHLAITTTGEVNTGALGTYTKTYTVKDAAGNTTTKTKVIEVIARPATFPLAHRLLLQATFGPTKSDLDQVQSIGTTAWIDQQLAMPSAYDNSTDEHKTHLQRTVEIAQEVEPNTNWYGTSGIFNKEEASFALTHYQMAAWWENVIGLHPQNTLHGSDQLRQRVSYALSQLLVTSAYEVPLHRRGEGLAYYYDILTRNAFGNYRDLLGEVARSSTMGIYLSHQGNRKTDITAGTRPDENFARELMQLFTVGVHRLNRDGTADRDSNPLTYPDAGSDLVPTYTINDIEELAKVMTGWDLMGNNRYGVSSAKQGDYTKPMEFTAAEHEEGTVSVLGSSFSLSSGGDGSGMDAALDVLFNHPNVGPFVSKQLIMRLVTSNPSTAYVDRVATVFNADSAGIRGNLKAVVRAILIDDEARSDTTAALPSFGKFKEPLLAWAQMLRATGAVPLEGWLNRDKTTTVSGVYWFRYPQKYLGQGPMRSPSVFNFYSDDYVPSDSGFTDANLVGPEMKIQTDQILLEYNNKVLTQLKTYERNKIVTVDGNLLGAFAATKSYSSDPVMLVNLDSELDIVKQALNGDYDNIDTDRETAVDALLTHLDKLLLGETMTTEYNAALKEYLLNANGIKDIDNFKEALNIVRNATRMIATSSTYMVQK